MRKYFLVIFLSLFCLSFSFGIANDSTCTYYKNGEFVSYCHVFVDVPSEIMNRVLDDFIFQSKYDLDELFNWALVDMRLRNEKDNLIVINMRSTYYDSKTGIIRSVNDVKVPNIIDFPNIHLNSRMTKSLLSDGRTNLDIDVLYSDAFLKKTRGNFQIQPKGKQKCIVKLETKVEFGWFFNFFITQSSFKHIMEWRFKKILQNVSQEAERRTKLISKLEY